MINRHHVPRMLQRVVTRIMRTAISAGTVAGLLALTIAVPRIGAQQRSAVRVPASVLERYVGEYASPDGETVMVRLRGDTLVREASGQQVAFAPLSETLFRLGPFFTVEFVVDEVGGMTQILTNTVSFERRFRRKGSPPAPPMAGPAQVGPAVRVPRSVLQRYVGIYEYIPGQMARTDLRLVVALRGDTLTRMMFGREQVLVPMSETRFRVAGTSLVAEFVVDEAGVTKVMGSGFQQMLARIPPKR